MKIAFAGLGVMGAPMARHLVNAGHPVVGFNRTPAKAQAWAEAVGARAAETVSEAAQGAELFILCVGNDDDVRAVVTEALPHLAEGAVIVDHTTTSAKLAREMAQALARAEPALTAYSKAIKHMGPAGSGQLTKMVNQIAIAGVIQGLAEAVHFAQVAGLDTDAVFEAVSKGAAQSWQMDNRWKTAAQGRFDFGFAVDWMRKDLGLVLDEARSNGARLALTALVDQFYAEVQAMGGNRWDTSSLAARLQPKD